MFEMPADPESLGRRLSEYVDEEIQKSKGIIIRAHRGRLQEAMHLLGRQLPDEVRFLAHPTDIRLVPTYRKYGMWIRDCISYESEDGRDTQEGGPRTQSSGPTGAGRGFWRRIRKRPPSSTWEEHTWAGTPRSEKTARTIWSSWITQTMAR